MSTILIVGASRGIGHAMAARFVLKEWNVIGTVRGSARTQLHDLQDEHPGRVQIKQLDMNEPSQIDQLKTDLSNTQLDILFVNSGTTNSNQEDVIGTVSTDEFVRVMVTNALSPMRVLEKLESLVTPTGLLGIMSSGQGSITNNERGMREVYRGSKAALNMYMKSFAVRQGQKHPQRSLVLTAPGWIKTDLGGDGAPFTLDDNIPPLVDVLLKKRERPGLEYLDYKGDTVPW